MANVTIPAHNTSNERRTDAVASRALAHEAAVAEKAEEQARIRSAALDAPWYNEKLDPNNFGMENPDPQHVAMFNGTRGGRSGASFPERTLDTGLHFNPTPSALSTNSASERDTVNPLHPEILTDIILDLWTPSTCNGALGQALVVATDAPPSIAGPSEPPMTISPPLDPADLPPPPDPEVFAPEGSSRAKRQADWAAQSEGGEEAGAPKQKNKEDAAKRKQQDEEKRQRDEAAKK